MVAPTEALLRSTPLTLLALTFALGCNGVNGRGGNAGLGPDGAADSGVDDGGPQGTEPDNGGEIPPDPDADDAEDELEDVTCDSTADCLSGEVCEDGVCQVERCQGQVGADPPLGQLIPLVDDGEVVMIDYWQNGGQHHLWSFDVNGGGVSLEGTTGLGSNTPVDVAGGYMMGVRPAAVAIAHEQSHLVRVVHPTEETTLDMGLVPVALATGDVDGNSLDDVLAVSAEGNWTSCHVPTTTCMSGSIPGVTVYDAAAGDVDGDGRAELVITGTDAQGYGTLVIVNLVSHGYAEPAQIQVQTDYAAWRVAVGDFDGDELAEVITMYDAGVLDALDDWFTAYAVDGEDIIALGSGGTGDHELIDIEAGLLEDGGPAQLIGLTDDAELEVIDWNGGGSFVGGRWQPSGNDNYPIRLALADTNGDATMAELVSGPKPMTGRVAPIAVLNYPPYDRRYSPDGSIIGFGTATTMSESNTTGVSFGVHGSVGYSGGLFGSGGSVKATIAATTSSAFETSESTTVESGFLAQADPKIQGPQASAVVLAWGCYEGFEYVVDDPAGLAEPEARDESFLVAVPVGGGTTVWSSHRYDAVIDALGFGPYADNHHHDVGDPATYDGEPMLPDGSPIAADDMLFPPTLDLWASDVARANFRLTMSESEQVSSMQGLSLEASAGISAAGFQFEGGASVGVNRGYSTSLATSTTINGDAPPLLDDPETPDDEYSQYRYSFSPYVYLRHYEDEDGGDASMLVVDYTVKR